MIAPKYNGINKYCKTITKELSKQHEIEQIGFEQIEFDETKILQNVTHACEAIEKADFDILHYNFGTYDAEQLIPLMLSKRKHIKNYKTLLTVHSNQYSLFRKIGNIDLFNEVNKSLKGCNSYIFFTKTIQEKWNVNSMQTIIKLCSTISPSVSYIDPQLIDIAKNNKKFFSVLGYASHWKDYNLVVNAAKILENEIFVFAGPFWSQKNIPPLDNIVIIDKELNDTELSFLIDNSIGLFPYVYYSDFQGSGMLPNFIEKNRPFICNNTKELIEYIDDKNRICDMKNLSTFCQKIVSTKNENIFYKNSSEYSVQKHCELITNFYKKVIGI